MTRSVFVNQELGLTLLWYHKKVTLTVPWGQYDPHCKKTII